MTLILNNLAFERNHQLLFQPVNCTLNAGDSLQVRGTNGSGKSTLLRILAGYIETEIGSVTWQGQSILQAENYSQTLCYLGHQNGIRPYLTTYENLKLYCALSAQKSESSLLISALRQVGLAHAIETQAVFLSAGQKRRLALARLLVNPKPLWILDEPTTALDADGVSLLNELLVSHLNQNGIAIVATHQEFLTTDKTQILYLDGASHV
jgi:heme exporter protein A